VLPFFFDVIVLAPYGDELLPVVRKGPRYRVPTDKGVVEVEPHQLPSALASYSWRALEELLREDTSLAPVAGLLRLSGLPTSLLEGKPLRERLLPPPPHPGRPWERARLKEVAKVGFLLGLFIAFWAFALSPVRTLPVLAGAFLLGFPVAYILNPKVELEGTRVVVGGRAVAGRPWLVASLGKRRRSRRFRKTRPTLSIPIGPPPDEVNLRLYEVMGGQARPLPLYALDALLHAGREVELIYPTRAKGLVDSSLKAYRREPVELEEGL